MEFIDFLIYKNIFLIFLAFVYGFIVGLR